jgi:uncharacterized membrane protein (UPF0127 family)
MNRRQFTKAVVQLISEMIESGETPIMDYLLRSKSEQGLLFKAGLSKCDGIKIISNHQKALAIDIYFVDKNGRVEYAEEDLTLTVHPIRDRYEKWHKRWVELGGRLYKDNKVMLEWDCGHYE